MADSVGIPASACRGDWLANKSVDKSSPAGICLAAFEKLRRGKPAWLCEAGTVSRSTSSCSSLAGSIFVRTGGSAGNPRLARHTWATMAAAVKGLQVVLGEEPIRSWCCLPVWHVGGWMQVMRAVETGGDVVFGDYLDLADPKVEVNLSGRMVSLVPTQLHRLLFSNLAVARLRESRLILLGGGPVREDLAGRARKGELPVALTYGLTETAGAVTLLAPERFLSGEDGVGSALPHAELRLVEETNTLSIRTKSLCLGYEDCDFPLQAWFPTADLAEQDPNGTWRILGRTDRVVNTGGEKVNPTEVEAVIRETGLVDDCLVLGLPDPEWGEHLVAFCVPKSTKVDLVDQAIRTKLLGSKVPKIILPVVSLPTNEMGKPNYERAARMLAD